MTLARRAARNFSAQVASFVATFADRLVLTGLLIRAWGVEQFSDWATLVAAAGMLAMSDFGFQTYLGNMLTRAGVRERGRAFRQLVRLGASFYLALFVLLVLGAVLTTGLLDVRKLLNLHGGELAPVLLVLLLHQTLRVARSSFVQVFRGKGENHIAAWTEARAQLASVICVSFAVLLGSSPLAAALIYLVGELIFGFGWALLTVRRNYPEVSLRPQWPNERQVRSGISELRWYAAFAIAGYFWLNLPVLILAWLGLAGAPLASFVVQRTLVNFARTVSAQLSNAVAIELARVKEERQGQALNAAVAAVARINMALAGLCVVGLVVFGRDVVGVWTGRAELGSLTVLLLLLLPVVSVACSGPLNLLAMYSGLLKSTAWASIAQIAIGLPLAAAGGHLFGLAGFAGGLAAGEVAGLAILQPVLASARLGIDYGRLAMASAGVLVLTWAWSAPIAWFCHSLPLPQPTGLFVQLALFGVLAGLPVAWFAVPTEWRNRAWRRRLST